MFSDDDNDNDNIKLLDNEEIYDTYDVEAYNGFFRKGAKLQLEFNYNLFVYRNNIKIKEFCYYNIIAWYHSQSKKKFGFKYKINNNNSEIILFKCKLSDPIVQSMRNNINQIIELYNCDIDEIRLNNN